MSTVERLQNDVYYRLLSESLLYPVNVKQLRKMRIDSEHDLSLIYAAKRKDLAGVDIPTATVGSGVLVGMPTLGVDHPNTPGPLLSLKLPIRVYEQPTFNLDPTVGNGSRFTAEGLMILIQQLLHQLGIEGLCGLYCEKDAGKPLQAEDEGVIAYEITLNAQLSQDHIPRLTQPSISQDTSGDGNGIILTPYEEAVTICYTVDGSMPGPMNPTSIIYTVPFNVPSGTILRWAGYKENWAASNAGYAEITRGQISTEEGQEPENPFAGITLPEGGGIMVE